MKRIAIILSMLAAGCGSESGGPDVDAPACSPPPLTCAEPVEEPAGRSVTVQCSEDGDAVFYDRAGGVVGWISDGGSVSVNCWPRARVGRVVHPDGSRECFDADGMAADCADVDAPILQAIADHLESTAR
jgi:hypothetical protein